MLPVSVTCCILLSWAPHADSKWAWRRVCFPAQLIRFPLLAADNGRGALHALQDLHLLQRLRLLTSSPVPLQSQLQPGRRNLPEQRGRA